MSEKRIVIFIPCYNAARTIGETLRSVRVAIAHTDFPVPVCIYDDSSTDDSVEIARSEWGDVDGLTIIRNKANAGERKTTNDAFGYFHGKYDWALMIHADDIVKPGWITELYSQILPAADDACFTVWSSFDALDDKTGAVRAGDNTGGVEDRQKTDSEKKYFITKLYGSWHISGAAFNVKLFRDLQGFDTTMPQFGDTDFYARGLLAGYRDIYISRTLTYYRVLETSVSSTSVRTNRDIKEGLYLVQKFSNMLDGRELRTLCRNIIYLSSRRSGRWLLKLNARNFFFCSSVTFNLLIKYLRTYGKVHS